MLPAATGDAEPAPRFRAIQGAVCWYEELHCRLCDLRLLSFHESVWVRAPIGQEIRRSREGAVRSLQEGVCRKVAARMGDRMSSRGKPDETTDAKIGRAHV